MKEIKLEQDKNKLILIFDNEESANQFKNLIGTALKIYGVVIK